MKCSELIIQGPIAQQVEHLTFNQSVAGSNPAGLTKNLVIDQTFRVNINPNMMNKVKSFREMYYDRPVAFHKDDK